jgi:uncharacterized membrane protein YgcG
MTMHKKFMVIKRIVLNALMAAILASQILGCSAVGSKELLDMINRGEQIVIEISEPSYEVVVKGKEIRQIDWVQLDQLKTFREFRLEFDKIFNINIVTEQGVNGKSGVLYVDENGNRNGNSSLRYAFRNKQFITKYWNKEEVKSQIIKIAPMAYDDLSDNARYALYGALNAYFDLIYDWQNPNSFNPTQSLTREEFYAMVRRADAGVEEIEIDKKFEEAVGGPTEYSKYAQEVDEYGFLNVENGSLDAANFKGTISRIEAIYLLVNKYFNEELQNVTGKEQAFKDAKNAGDLALKLRFKEKNKETGEIIEKDRWQAYTLAYMFQKPEHGIQEELYKALVVAKKLGLVEDEECRWDEPLNRAEAVELLTKVYMAENRLYGYLSTVEYGKMDETKLDDAELGGVEAGENTEESQEQGEESKNEEAAEKSLNEALAPVDPNKELSSGLTLGEAKFVIEDVRRVMREAGKSEEEIEAEVSKIAEELGTTLEEVDKVIIADKSSDDKNVASETGKGSGGNKQSSSNKSSGGSKSSSGGKTSQGGSKSGGSSGDSSIIYKRSPDEEDLEKYMIGSDGGISEVVPPNVDAGFHAPGEEP